MLMEFFSLTQGKSRLNFEKTLRRIKLGGSPKVWPKDKIWGILSNAYNR